MRKLLVYIGLVVFLDSRFAPAWGEKAAIYLVIFGVLIFIAKGMARTNKNLSKDVKRYYNRSFDPSYYDDHYKN